MHDRETHANRFCLPSGRSISALLPHFRRRRRRTIPGFGFMFVPSSIVKLLLPYCLCWHLVAPERYTCAVKPILESVFGDSDYHSADYLYIFGQYPGRARTLTD